jgi:hypothetical protein
LALAPRLDLEGPEPGLEQGDLGLGCGRRGRRRSDRPLRYRDEAETQSDTEHHGHALKLHPARGAVNAAHPPFPGASFLAAAVALAVGAAVLSRVKVPGRSAAG